MATIYRAAYHPTGTSGPGMEMILIDLIDNLAIRGGVGLGLTVRVYGDGRVSSKVWDLCPAGPNQGCINARDTVGERCRLIGFAEELIRMSGDPEGWVRGTRAETVRQSVFALGTCRTEAVLKRLMGGF